MQLIALKIAKVTRPKGTPKSFFSKIELIVIPVSTLVN